MDHYIFVYDTSRELYILARALLVTVLRGVWGVVGGRLLACGAVDVVGGMS